MRRIAFSGSGPDRSIFCWRETPSTNCMTRYGTGPSSSTAWIATTFSWVTAAAAWASRTNCRRALGLAANAGASALIATTRRSLSSNARKTIPIPPRPATSSTS